MKLPPHYTFADAALAEQALTHRSFAATHNERLEWLGDAVLQFEVSRLLYRRFPAIAEGGLSQLRARLVSSDMLAQMARRLALSDYARLGRAGMHSGRDNEKLLANLMEAYLAAIYLDGGDVAAFIQTWFAAELDTLAAQMKRRGVSSLQNVKTQLQEFLQQQKQPPPAYTLLHRQGKPDKPIFLVECRVNGEIAAQGRGSSRARAEQAAAAECLAQLAQIDQLAPPAPPASPKAAEGS